jgi:hydrogenase-4 component F
VFGQRDVKRLLAYSSVEHMGILAIGVAFGAPIALAGVLLHVIAHAAAKGNAFMGAGVFTVKYGTKQMSAMRDGLRLLPWSGPLFLLAVFALSAFPPFGLFRSESEIVAGGLGQGDYAAAAVLVVLVTIAFFGLATSTTNILLRPVPTEKTPSEEISVDVAVSRMPTAADAADAADGNGSPRTVRTVVAVETEVRAPRVLRPGEPSAWMVVPVLAGLVVLVLLGVHPPGELTNLITQAADELRGAP